MDEQVTQAAKKPKRKWRLPGWSKILIAVLLTLALSAGMCCLLLGRSGIAMVQTYLLAKFAFVDTGADLDKAVDQGLDAFVDALGDRWSYYLDKEGYQSTTERRANNYVGIGITVDTTREEGTQVTLTLLGEDGSTRDVACTRATLYNASAVGTLLEGNIGYVRMKNFYSGSAGSFRTEVDSLIEQGAESLIVDVRNDPGGYVSQLERVLDYLLPEVPVFTHKPRWWFKTVYMSDADCIDLPMVVIVNEHTYSAAELLAAQLRDLPPGQRRRGGAVHRHLLHRKRPLPHWGGHYPRRGAVPARGRGHRRRGRCTVTGGD